MGLGALGNAWNPAVSKTGIRRSSSPQLAPRMRGNRTAATVRRFAHVVEGRLVSTAQIARRIGVTSETALRRVKRGPFPLTWDGLATSRRKTQ